MFYLSFIQRILPVDQINLHVTTNAAFQTVGVVILTTTAVMALMNGDVRQVEMRGEFFFPKEILFTLVTSKHYRHNFVMGPRIAWDAVTLPSNSKPSLP